MLGFIVWPLLKYSFYLFLVFLIYNLYQYFYIPWAARRRFSRYYNVHLNDKPAPLIGDAHQYMEDMKAGRVNFYHQIEYALELKDIDIRVSVIGSQVYVNIFSQKAVKEFIEKVPKVIDRHSIGHGSFGKMFPTAFIMNYSDENWKKRREGMLKEIGINFSSKYIPTMIEAAGEKVQNWKDGESRNLLKEMADTTFVVITTMLFGRNISEEIGKIEYLDPNNYTYYELQFDEFYTRVSKDLMGNRFKFKTLFLPFLSRYDLTVPYNINYYNIKALWKALQSHLDKNPDKDSVYHRVMQTPNAEKDEVFQDLLSLLFAGHETSSHAICSTIYFLYKNPEIKEKLEQELSEFKGQSHESLLSSITKSKLEELEYLHLVVKEGLRIDPPASDAVPYEVLQDTEICEVPLKRGDVLNLNILPQHYNPDMWHEPLKFIPERFDPESEFYTCPKTGKPRDPLSWMPFSTHLRNCPGQTLAMLEIKVLLVYLLTRVDFEFENYVMESPYAYFSIISQLTLDFTAQVDGQEGEEKEE